MADPRTVPKRQGRRSGGNTVEGKTLKTRQKGMNMLEKKPHAAAWLSRKRYRGRGSRGRKVAVITQRGRYSAVTGKDQKTSGGNRIAQRYPGANTLRSFRLSGPDQSVPASPAILGVR